MEDTPEQFLFLRNTPELFNKIKNCNVLIQTSLQKILLCIDSNKFTENTFTYQMNQIHGSSIPFLKLNELFAVLP